ncbi:MAG: PRC-barrel domain-containing protein [Chloroflexota bacterium]
MQYEKGTDIVTADGEKVGELEEIVMNPATHDVTHLVVRKGFLFPDEDKVMPVSWIVDATDERIVLRGDIEGIEELPPFEEMHYRPIDPHVQKPTEPPTRSEPAPSVPNDYTPLYYYGPVMTWWSYPRFFEDDKSPQYVEVTERNIPEHAVAINFGTDVLSSDGEKVGTVERVFAHPIDDHITHIQTEKGLPLLKDRKLIPTMWIDRVYEEHIVLAVPYEMVTELPEYEESNT